MDHGHRAGHRAAEEQIDDAWDTLIRGGSLPARLRAVALLRPALEDVEGGAYGRLEDLLPGLPAAPYEAARRSLLDARRSAARRWRLRGSWRNRRFGPDDPLAGISARFSTDTMEQRLELVESFVTREAFQAAPILEGVFHGEPDEAVRASLAHALGYLGSDSVLPIFEACSTSPAKAVRLGALEGLRHQCGPAATDLLLRWLGDEDEAIRSRALELASSRDPQTIEDLLASGGRYRSPTELRGLVALLAPWVGDESVDRSLQALSRLPGAGVSRLARRVRGCPMPGDLAAPVSLVT